MATATKSKHARKAKPKAKRKTPSPHKIPVGNTIERLRLPNTGNAIDDFISRELPKFAAGGGSLAPTRQAVAEHLLALGIQKHKELYGAKNGRRSRT